MRGIDHVGARLVEHRAPFRRRRLGAHAEEGEAGGGDDRGAHAHREVNHDRRDRPRQDVAHEDDPVRGADAAYCLDVGHVLEREGVAAHQAGERGDAEHRDRDDDVDHAAAKDRDDAQSEQDAGKGEEYVGNAHHDAVPPALVVTGKEAQRGADDPAECDGKEPGRQRDACPGDDAAEDVAPERINAQPVLPGWSLVEPVVVEEILRVVRDDQRCEDGDEHEQDDEAQGAHGHRLLLELAPEFAPRRAHLVAGDDGGVGGYGWGGHGFT